MQTNESYNKSIKHCGYFQSRHFFPTKLLITQFKENAANGIKVNFQFSNIAVSFFKLNNAKTARIVLSDLNQKCIKMISKENISCLSPLHL